ncbi:MAG TPA: hypothetical protein VFE33_08215 [Thermoanaerobaculia bacterium]|nr:hypothetical protein [Thermoanaerobaculia bacterium]
MRNADTPAAEPKAEKPTTKKGKLDAHQPVETAVVRDPDPNAAPPGRC